MLLQELLGKIENELKLRNYSRKTIDSYTLCLRKYFKYAKNIECDPDIATIKVSVIETTFSLSPTEEHLTQIKSLDGVESIN